MTHDLQHKVALVTGGSRGLGAAISLSLAARGAKVAINYLAWAEEANFVRSEILRNGGQADIFPADVTNEVYAGNVPLRRMGDPNDVGEMVAFLASDAAKFITGQRICVNGGNTMP